MNSQPLNTQCVICEGSKISSSQAAELLIEEQMNSYQVQLKQLKSKMASSARKMEQASGSICYVRQLVNRCASAETKMPVHHVQSVFKHLLQLLSRYILSFVTTYIVHQFHYLHYSPEKTAKKRRLLQTQAIMRTVRR